MAQEIINIGLQADDGTGDTVRGSGVKINNNFTEVYARPHLVLSHLEFSGNQVKGTPTNADLELSASSRTRTDSAVGQKLKTRQCVPKVELAAGACFFGRDPDIDQRPPGPPSPLT